jgi:hypothetical protein
MVDVTSTAFTLSNARCTPYVRRIACFRALLDRSTLLHICGSFALALLNYAANAYASMRLCARPLPLIFLAPPRFAQLLKDVNGGMERQSLLHKNGPVIVIGGFWHEWTFSERSIWSATGRSIYFARTVFTCTTMTTGNVLYVWRVGGAAASLVGGSWPGRSLATAALYGPSTTCGALALTWLLLSLQGVLSVVHAVAIKEESKQGTRNSNTSVSCTDRGGFCCYVRECTEFVIVFAVSIFAFSSSFEFSVFPSVS